jgi:hypothetical protein
MDIPPEAFEDADIVLTWWAIDESMARIFATLDDLSRILEDAEQ